MSTISSILSSTKSVQRFILSSLCILLLFSFMLGSYQPASAQVAPASPDLVVTSVTWGTNCEAKFTIKNIGSGNATGNFPFIASPLYVPAWGTGPQTGWSATIFGLPSGQTITHKWQNVKSWHSPMIKVTVDPQNQVVESSEGNNSLAVAVPLACQY